MLRSALSVIVHPQSAQQLAGWLFAARAGSPESPLPPGEGTPASCTCICRCAGDRCILTRQLTLLNALASCFLQRVQRFMLRRALSDLLRGRVSDDAMSPTKTSRITDLAKFGWDMPEQELLTLLKARPPLLAHCGTQSPLSPLSCGNQQVGCRHRSASISLGLLFTAAQRWHTCQPGAGLTACLG